MPLLISPKRSNGITNIYGHPVLCFFLKHLRICLPKFTAYRKSELGGMAAFFFGSNDAPDTRHN